MNFSIRFSWALNNELSYELFMSFAVSCPWVLDEISNNNNNNNNNNNKNDIYLYQTLKLINQGATILAKLPWNTFEKLKVWFS